MKRKENELILERIALFFFFCVVAAISYQNKEMKGKGNANPGPENSKIMQFVLI